MTAPASTWAPLRTGAFRTLWIAALVSNVGEWMQTVGAQWLLVHDSHAAILVSLVQTADALPAVLFALVAGVLADIFNRVRLLLAVLAGMTAAGGALTALTAAHLMPPALLLLFTFVLGTGGILAEPAYQSLVPDLVPRPQVPAASALGSVSINLARVIGPAIGGLLVARIGVAAVFGLNTATFVLGWCPPSWPPPSSWRRARPPFGAGRSSRSRTWTEARSAGPSRSSWSAPIAMPDRSLSVSATPSRPTGSGSSGRSWAACASPGCGPGHSTGPCTRTPGTRACSSSSSPFPAGKNTSGSTRSGRPPPTWATTTTRRRYRTRRREPSTTWRPTCASSPIAAGRPAR
jgi:MFS family permease